MSPCKLDWLSIHILDPRNLSIAGGDEEDRTPDPLRARQVLSQLSYTPIIRVKDMPLSLMKIHVSWAFKIEQHSKHAIKLLTG